MTHRWFRRFRRAGDVFAVLLMVFASSAVRAQKSPALDRVSVWVGGYYAQADTTIGAGETSGQWNGGVNLERELGFNDHKTVPRVRADFLLGDSQGFSLDFYSVNRASRQRLASDVSYDGNVYGVDTLVRGRLDFDFGSAAYRWWLGHGNNVFGIGFGGAYYRVHAAISGTATVNGIPTGQASSDSRVGAWAPMLQLGWRHAFNEQWRIYLDASGVKKNGGRLSGHIFNAALGAEWFPWRNVGVGAEYGYARIKLDQRKHDYNLNLAMRFHGPSMFVRLRF
jgi:hypothetical protein